MIRSHHSLEWLCCGVVHPASHAYCQHCGAHCFIADRMLTSFPIDMRGELAVVANTAPNAAAWRLLIQYAELTASAYEAQERGVAALQPTPMDSP